MRVHPETNEGPGAFMRFRDALKAVPTVPESGMPLSPFKKSAPKERRRATGGERVFPRFWCFASFSPST
jgi:hypothetical protein